MQNKPYAGTYQPLPYNPPASTAAGASSAFAKPTISAQIIIPLSDLEYPRAASACSGKSSTSSVASLPIGASASNLFVAGNNAASALPPPPAGYAGSTASSSSSAARSNDKNTAASGMSSSQQLQQHQVLDGAAPYFDSGIGVSRLRPCDPSIAATSTITPPLLSGPPSQYSGSGSGQNAPIQTSSASAYIVPPMSYPTSIAVGNTYVPAHRDSAFPNPMVPVPLPRTQCLVQQPMASTQFAASGFSELQSTAAFAPQPPQCFNRPQQCLVCVSSAVPEVREQLVFAVPAPPSQPLATCSKQSADGMPPASSTSSTTCSSRRMASAGVQTSNLFETPSNYMLVSHIGAAASGQPEIAVPSATSSKSTGAQYSFDEVDPPMNSTLTNNAQLQASRMLKVAASSGQVLLGSPRGDEPVLTGSHRNQLNLSPLQPMGNVLENQTQLTLKPFAMPSSTPAGTLAFGSATPHQSGILEYMIDPQFLDVGGEVTIAQQENTPRAPQTGYSQSQVYTTRVATTCSTTEARSAAPDTARFAFPTLDLSYK